MIRFLVTLVLWRFSNRRSIRWKKTAPTISKTGHPSASINLYYQDTVLLCREYGESTSIRNEAKKTAFLFKVISD